MSPETQYPECGAVLPADQTCQDALHQMLYWENEDPGNGVVHHLLVLCYNIQHPSLYSPAGLKHAQALLVDVLERSQTPQDLRRTHRDLVDSGKRTWKIKGRPDSFGAYPQPIPWTLTTRSMLDDLRASGKL